MTRPNSLPRGRKDRSVAIRQALAAEVAAALQITIPAVKSRLHMARAEMRAKLAPLAQQFGISVG